jgi:hypothetical protein
MSFDPVVMFAISFEVNVLNPCHKLPQPFGDRISEDNPAIDNTHNSGKTRVAKVAGNRVPGGTLQMLSWSRPAITSMTRPMYTDITRRVLYPMGNRARPFARPAEHRPSGPPVPPAIINARVFEGWEYFLHRRAQQLPARLIGCALDMVTRPPPVLTAVVAVVRK